MKFSVITPSFGQLEFLKLNAVSVADQVGEGIEVEHLVQDGGSTDGTAEWLAGQEGILGVVEKDEGMYDAINRGLRRATGEVYSWLNCDEQYLPGALAAVGEYFTAHPEVDIAFGHTIVVDTDCEYLCHRKAFVPDYGLIRIGQMPIHSSSMFFRSRVVDEAGLTFDSQWRASGDHDWFCRAMEKGMKLGLVPRFLSSFTETGDNLDQSPGAVLEHKRLRKAVPRAYRICAPGIRLMTYAKKFCGGHYRQEPFSYSIYHRDSGGERREYRADKPTFFWPGRMFNG